MKQLSKPLILTALCAALGLVCMCIRQWLLTAAIDEKGLVITAHPANWISWLLLAAALVYLAPAWIQKQNYRIAPMPLSGAGSLFCAAGYVISGLQLLPVPGIASLAACILAFVCALCAILIAAALFTRKHVNPLLYYPCVLFFLVLLLFRYQQWSGESELQRYFFQLAAGVALLFTAYLRSELAASKSNGRAYLLCSRGTLFLCLAAIPGSHFGALLGTCAVSLLLDGCRRVTEQPAGE